MKGKGKAAQYNIIRDPNLAKNRIYLGNLPECTSEQLESICLPYGTVLGSLVQKNFGFVQFESEEIANKVATALNKSTFKGNVITVRNAEVKNKTPAAAHQNRLTNDATNRTNTVESTNHDANSTSTAGAQQSCNDCEIIVVDRKNTKYAEYIEDRLKRLHMRVDVLFPNADVSLGKVLSSISSRGCLYAVLVTNQHEEHQSITVNILYGQLAEHRNMPIEDAIKLISEDFRLKMAREGRTPGNIGTALNSFLQPTPIINSANSIVPALTDRHPESIQFLINLLASNRPLTVLQYDRILKYLHDRRELQLNAELGDTSSTYYTPDPEIELQKKIKDIMSKPSVADNTYPLLYSTLNAVKEDYRLMMLLKDTRVQNALETLMSSNLVTSVETAMKF